jgi:tetratricopeptide (TPR) repeat protein
MGKADREQPNLAALENLLGESIAKLKQSDFSSAYTKLEYLLQEMIAYNVPDSKLLGSTLRVLADAYVLGAVSAGEDQLRQEAFSLLSAPGMKTLLAEFCLLTLMVGDRYFQHTGNELALQLILEPGQKAVDLWTELNDELRLARAESILAVALDAQSTTLYAGLGLLEQAAYRLERLAQFDDSADTRRIAALMGVGVFTTLANVYFSKGIFDESIIYYRRVQAVHEQEEDWPSLTTSHLSLGNTLLQMRRIEEAIAEFKKGQELATRLQDWPSLAQLYKGLSAAYKMSNQFVEAELQFDLAADALERLDDGGGVLSMWRDLAASYEERSQWEKAMRAYMKAKEMASNLGRLDEQLVAEYRLGNLYFEQRNVELARKYFLEARELAEKLGSDMVLAQINSYLAFLDNSRTSGVETPSEQ